jgi:hypothetical protein
MQLHSSSRRAQHPSGGTTMKAIASLAIGAIALAAASSAAAQSTVDMTGTAEAECHLPDTWQFISSGGFSGAGSFNAADKTWTIPSALLTDTTGMSAAGSEVAIRIRGSSFCNTAHTIILTSQNGGLVADAAPVAGLTNRRTMKYEAYWGNGSGSVFATGGNRNISFSPTTPGQSRQGDYTITPTAPPPGSRAFDIRMGLQRTGLPTQPMLSGDYEDVITVTLTPMS